MRNLKQLHDAKFKTTDREEFAKRLKEYESKEDFQELAEVSNNYLTSRIHMYFDEEGEPRYLFACMRYGYVPAKMELLDLGFYQLQEAWSLFMQDAMQVAGDFFPMDGEAWPEPGERVAVLAVVDDRFGS